MSSRVRFDVRALCLLAFAATSAVAADCRLYAPDPSHLWNRLHEALVVRVGPDGTRYGCDRIDPLYWANTKHLLGGASHRAAIQVLDEFVSGHGASLVRDPLKRAFLQHDLWTLFDWVTAGAGEGDPFAPERQALQRRLALAIRQVTLTAPEIAALPDNYVSTLTAERDIGLPEGLRDAAGPWVEVGAVNAVAPRHMADLGGRSVFRVFLRLPGRRSAAMDYLARLGGQDYLWTGASSNRPGDEPLRIRSDLPQFPAGTQWALLRSLVVLDIEGTPHETSIVESVQLRFHDAIPAGFASPDLLATALRFREFVARRSDGGQLRPVTDDETDFQFVQFSSMGFDPIEHAARTGKGGSAKEMQRLTLAQCASCHAAPGIYATRILIPFGPGGNLRAPGITVARPDDQAALTAAWKRKQFDFGLLSGLLGRPD
jgi:hypothetical protein